MTAPSKSAPILRGLDDCPKCGTELVCGDCHEVPDACKC